AGIAASGSGGGISSDGILTLSDTTISGNFVGLGGGGLSLGGTATITNTTITSNQAYGSEGTAVFGRGGGIQITSGTVTISNCIFSGNTVADSGGAIANSGTLTVIDTNIGN